MRAEIDHYSVIREDAQGGFASGIQRHYVQNLTGCRWLSLNLTLTPSSLSIMCTELRKGWCWRIYSAIDNRDVSS